LSLRNELGVNQLQMAQILGTQQTNISRWEGGLTTPSRKFQTGIERLASGMGLANLSQINELVIFSPFNMVLLASDMHIVAMSDPARQTLSQYRLRPTTGNQDYATQLNSQLVLTDFWKKTLEKLEVVTECPEIKNKTTITPVIIHGEKYALAQIDEIV
jgi:transcriptional regulator with XRE-family HTH domain